MNKITLNISSQIRLQHYPPMMCRNKSWNSCLFLIVRIARSGAPILFVKWGDSFSYTMSRSAVMMIKECRIYLDAVECVQRFHAA